MKITNDKYYTPINIANHCCDKVLEIIGENNISEVIEPAVGNGAFLHHENLFIHFGYDIAPEILTSCNTHIIEADFLKTNVQYLEGRLIIGNPPFGEKMNLAQKFYKKSIQIADYIAFILPIGQLNNNHSLFEFDLIYSEDLGIQSYSDVKLHCCFNIYRRPLNGNLNSKPLTKLQDITIYRKDAKDYINKPYDLRMCYWGNSAGKILNENEHYSGEYKIKINNLALKDEIINILSNFNWSDYLNCIAMKSIRQFHIIDILKRYIPNIR